MFVAPFLFVSVLHGCTGTPPELLSFSHCPYMAAPLIN